jgi:hypothetical protein
VPAARSATTRGLAVKGFWCIVVGGELNHPQHLAVGPVQHDLGLTLPLELTTQLLDGERNERADDLMADVLPEKERHVDERVRNDSARAIAAVPRLLQPGIMTLVLQGSDKLFEF